LLLLLLFFNLQILLLLLLLLSKIFLGSLLLLFFNLLCCFLCDLVWRYICLLNLCSYPRWRRNRLLANNVISITITDVIVLLKKLIEIISIFLLNLCSLDIISILGSCSATLHTIKKRQRLFLALLTWLLLCLFFPRCFVEWMR